MSERKNPRDRSVSGDIEDSDFESHEGDGGGNLGKPGRKKNPNSQAARRDQNRIAQREFRQRKQQRIRDLEARVEILSGGHDEALAEMRNMLKDLMTENHTLRGLVRSLAGFIGEGAGGLLPKLGWELADFNNFINRSETDTAFESFQRRKKQANSQTSTPSASAPLNGQGQKRAAEDEAESSRGKKAKGMNGHGEAEQKQDGYSMLAPDSIYPASRTPAQGNNAMFSDLMRIGSPMFAQPSPPSNVASHYNGPIASHVNNYQNSFLPTNIAMTMPSPVNTMPFPSQSTTSTDSQQRLPPSTLTSLDQEEDDDPQKVEAYKLIRYHLDNYKRNSAYCLPASLRPTLVQRTVPHESVIDTIIHPDLRDRMILLRSKFDLVDCLHSFKDEVTLHGDDVLAHVNWELSEKWLRQYGFLVEQTLLNGINKWRRERGEPDIHLADIAPPESASAS
ncbi:hypothetical protein PTI98_004863 [Pleurotus ostreatus]|nr:hypothetical protein PTI98_004863 [Pleurotus ostreatus]